MCVCVCLNECKLLRCWSVPLIFVFSPQLSQCERAVQAVERELAAHRHQWEVAMATIEQHHTAISDLSTQKEQLRSEIEQKEARVQELEALVEEVTVFACMGIKEGRGGEIGGVH